MIPTKKYTAQKMKLHFPADLVTFTEEIFNGKLHVTRSSDWIIFGVNF